MEEDIKKTDGAEQDNAPDAAINTEKSGPPDTVPYARFQEKVSEFNTLKEQNEAMAREIAKIKEAQEKERTKKLEENEQFKELADEWKAKFDELEPQLGATRESLEAHQAALTGFANSQMEKVPELFREIVEKLPLLERLTWLSENVEKLEKNNTAPIPPTPKGQGANRLPDEERRKRAARTF